MSAEYLITVGDPSQLPTLLKGSFLKGHRQPRIAMVGRSNVGKSSLINTIIGGRLAQTSKEPGKTRHIHFYLWKEGQRIVADLPGYGFAKTSVTERNKWAVFIEAYLTTDENLQAALVLLDARHGPTESDLDAIQFLMGQEIPIFFIFTKSDTLKTQAERSRRKKETAKTLEKLGVDQDHVFWVSCKTKDGTKALATALAGLPSVEELTPPETDSSSEI